MAPKASKKAKPKAKKVVRDLPLKADKAKHVKGGAAPASPWHIQKW